MTRSSIASIALIVIVLVTLLWLSRDRLMRGSSRQQASEKPAAAVSGGATSALFTSRAIGDPPKGEKRPQIAHVAIVDLDRDGLNDVLVCDSFRNIVTWIRQAPRGTFSESVIAGVSAPAHVEAIDFDRDGDLDLVVAALGFLFPNNNRVGSVIVMENDGQQKFRSHYIADRVARVADARAADLDGDGDLAQGWGNSLSILARTSVDQRSIASTLRAILHDANPTVPVKFETMEELFDATLAYPRFRTRVIGLFAVAAALLASVGIFSVLAYLVGQRTREIAVRRTLGARAADVIHLLVGQGIRLIAIGLALGLAGALAVARLLTGLLYEISPWDVATYLGTIAVLGTAALLAILLPAIRAASIAPVIVLQQE
jgi:hypothetical protein